MMNLNIQSDLRIVMDEAVHPQSYFREKLNSFLLIHFLRSSFKNLLLIMLDLNTHHRRRTAMEEGVICK